jgi:hypothetical protein
MEIIFSVKRPSLSCFQLFWINRVLSIESQVQIIMFCAQCILECFNRFRDRGRPIGLASTRYIFSFKTLRPSLQVQPKKPDSLSIMPHYKLFGVYIYIFLYCKFDNTITVKMLFNGPQMFKNVFTDLMQRHLFDLLLKCDMSSTREPLLKGKA